MANKFNVVTLISVAVLTISLGMTLFIQNAPATETPDKAKPPAMAVDITVVKEQSLRLWAEFSGRLTAVDYVEIRPQASGIITEVKFEDGQYVNKGDILYIIDPRPLKAIVDQEKADLIAAQNRYNLAKKQFKRAQDLKKKNLTSEQLYDERVNTKLVADAAVKRAQAKLSVAEINLGYAYIKTPVSGRVSRAELTEGNLVAAGPNAPLLTTVVSSKHIYADFEVDEQTYTHYIERISSTKNASNTTQNKPPKNPVELRLQSGELVFHGNIHAFDNKIDSTSGTIRARAIFDNPQGILLPGMYARLELGSINEEKIILISENAIGTDQNRKFVYIVDKDNKTTYREVKLGNNINGYRVIRAGLSAGDKVIVRGLMRIHPDMLVSPKVATTSDEKTKINRS